MMSVISSDHPTVFFYREQSIRCRCYTPYEAQRFSFPASTGVFLRDPATSPTVSTQQRTCEGAL